jgi:hypothetical protein
MKVQRVVLFGLFLAVSVSSAAAQFSDLMGRLGFGKQLSDNKITSGLKEALRVGTDNAVKSTGRTDGYFLNEAIKIQMPEKLRTVEKGLRLAGYGSQLDELVLGMNRAAEKSAPLAKDIFLDAIYEMSIKDARNILTGGDTAATSYFKDKTKDRLSEAFRPIVETAMGEVGVSRQYNQLIASARKIPFLNQAFPAIEDYVVSEALDGLFYVLGDEERKIRRDPAARVTKLLQEVFRQ